MFVKPKCPINFELFILALSSKFLGTSDVSGIDIDKLKFEFSSRNRSIKARLTRVWLQIHYPGRPHKQNTLSPTN